ncbi:hypothetical protein [Methanimicrococcus blatticola]|uniref:Uncharacterized protein n=1 Tax=Methanimicrococcus blatticola TaxID=91560 RepID=A0A484F6T2_9EURY|nr:hypothetical protein [Methanimicrococcus blatticola]MBZ3935085.1 hypothetical protein [Methanimicrococcus blatticola]MCC2508818.1 hypothetical protein [Methanimicrococcus blatticola]TDQ71153.1 hypothetical protein C7391_0255 [Methanimicrococcus blatticola]
MTKVLSLHDLINRKRFELAEMSGENAELEDLYDLVIPMGVPMSIIMDMVEMFELEAVDRLISITEPEIAQTPVIALRGPLENVLEAEKFMKQEMKIWLES